MTNKEKYIIFCEKTYIPIFSQPWWLDATCGSEKWDVYVVEHGGTFMAAMPYYVEEKDGYRKITKPTNTQNNGIIYNYPEGIKYVSKLDFEERMINEVADFIETLNLDKYEQQFHYSFTNWLPFYWRNYNLMLRYTYVIEDTSDMLEVEAAMSSKMKNTIRKAQKCVKLSERFSIEDFFRVNEMSFTRQNIPIPYSLDYVTRIYRACKERGAGRILFAVDDNEEIHSCAFIAWDEQSVYYLMSGTNPVYKSSQANSFLIYESIKIASEKGLKFDFEGSVIKQIERSFRQYGGVQKPYFRIYKDFEQ